MSVSSISSGAIAKKSEKEVEAYASSLKRVVHPDIIGQTFSCYTGFKGPVDYSIKRPVDFIGPLEYELLPDSPTRRVLWLAAVHFDKTSAIEIMSTLPGIDIIKKVDSPELVLFPSEHSLTKKDCFDEAF